MRETGETERWKPVPVPKGDGRHDIGDDTRAAIFHRLHDDFTLAAPWMTAEQRRQLSMLAAASVRALLHELGALKVMEEPAAAPVREGETPQAGRRDYLIENLRGMCAFRSPDGAECRDVRAVSEFCTACLAATRLEIYEERAREPQPAGETPALIARLRAATISMHITIGEKNTDFVVVPDFLLAEAADAMERLSTSEQERAKLSAAIESVKHKHVCSSCDLSDQEYAEREGWNAAVAALKSALGEPR